MQLRRPSPAQIDAQLADDDARLTYTEVGATRVLDSEPAAEIGAHYDVDRREVAIGRGRDVFERARDALLGWRHFDVPWLELHGANTPVEVGQRVVSVVRVLGVWLVNPCQVVYLDREEEAANRLRFAYGTLPGHAERGEERFTVSYDAVSQDVRYEIVAFSRPALPLVRIGYPYARRIQRRFARASAEALHRAVS